MARAAAETASAKLDPQRRAVLRVRAVELQQRAARLRKVADDRWSKTEKLLRRLRDHEGADFVHYEPPRGLDTDQVNAGINRPPYGVLQLRRPTTLQIRGEADLLDRLAGELEQWATSDTESEVATRARNPVRPPSQIERDYAG